MSKASKVSLKLSSSSALVGLNKTKCKQCQRNRMYFCYDCLLLLDNVFSPTVTLPCLVDIIKHPKEKNSKSTAIHCKIVAPSQTRVFHVPDVPDYRSEMMSENKEEGSTVLVFPSPTAVSIDEFMCSNGPIKRLVVIDSTWFQVGQMQKTPQIQGLPCVSLRNYQTAFWRPQHNMNNDHLATIEAIYYALKEYQELGLKMTYKGEFDDLLFWFFFVRDKVDAREDAYLKRKAEEENVDREKRGKTEDDLNAVNSIGL